jgi:hypothetical protein
MTASAFARSRFTRLLVLGLTLCLGSLSAWAQSSVIVVDAFNRKVHVAGNANAKRPVGGLAKIATCMVALDWAEASRVGVNVLAPVPDYATAIAGAPSPLGLQPGDTMTLRDLIYATMMGSDNVAAITLGDFVGQAQGVFAGAVGDARLCRAGASVCGGLRGLGGLGGWGGRCAVGAGAGYKREAGEEGSVHRGVRPGQRGLMDAIFMHGR